MTLTITNLRVDAKGTEVPYLIVNCCFKIERDEDFQWQRAKAESEEYQRVLTIDDPEKYEAWLENAWGFDQFKYAGYGKAWIHNDQMWQYIEKFDTFWFREWVADCPVTRAIVSELEYYREHGKLPSVYRATDEGTILRHLRALYGYWD